MASKFLTLQESVRDAADLYLSLKYPPPIFVCDTPCGFVRHMDCRDKTTASKLWGSNSGCFEVPSMEKLPKEVLCSCLLMFATFLVSGNEKNDKNLFVLM